MGGKGWGQSGMNLQCSTAVACGLVHFLHTVFLLNIKSVPVEHSVLISIIIVILYMVMLFL